MSTKLWWTSALFLLSYCATAEADVEPLFPLLVNRDVGNQHRSGPLFPLVSNRDVSHYSLPPSNGRNLKIKVNSQLLSDTLVKPLFKEIIQNRLRNLVSQPQHTSNRNSVYNSRSHHNQQSRYHSNRDDENPLEGQLFREIDRLLKENNADLVVLPENIHRLCNKYLKTNQLSPAPLTLVQKDGIQISKHATGLTLPPEKVERLCSLFLGFNPNKDDSSSYEDNNFIDRRKFTNVKLDSGTLPMNIPDKYWVQGSNAESKESAPHPRSVDKRKGWREDARTGCPLCGKLAKLIHDHEDAGHPRHFDKQYGAGDNFYGHNPNDVVSTEQRSPPFALYATVR